MFDLNDPKIGVLVDYDPGVWLGGPPPGAEPPLVAQWIAGAVDACATDFNAVPGDPVHEYLTQTLTAFAEAEVTADVRLLRMRGPESAPLVVLVTVLQGEAGVDLAALDPSVDWYSEPTVTPLEPEDLGWRRSLAYEVNSGTQLRSLIRYHRRVDSLDADVLLSCAGADPVATAEGLPDLDDLARVTWLVTSDDEQERL